MPFAVYMLLALAALIIGIWLYNHRPEQILQNLGREFEIDGDVLVAESNPHIRLKKVRAKMELDYDLLCHRIRSLLSTLMLRNPEQIRRLQRRLEWLSKRRSNANACRRLLDLLATLEHYDLLGGFQMEDRMDACERESWRLESAFRKIVRIKKRLKASYPQPA